MPRALRVERGHVHGHVARGPVRPEAPDAQVARARREVAHDREVVEADHDRRVRELGRRVRVDDRQRRARAARVRAVRDLELVVAARVARGPVTPLDQASADDYDAVLMPGGFGAAKNLCTWAFEGANCEVDATVENFLRAMHAKGAWIGACCIAPVILAKVFGDQGVEVTIGQGDAEHAEVEKTGAKHIKMNVNGVHRDDRMRVLTTPAYMEAQRIAELPTGINELVRQLIEA